MFIFVLASSKKYFPAYYCTNFFLKALIKNFIDNFFLQIQQYEKFCFKKDMKEKIRAVDNRLILNNYVENCFHLITLKKMSLKFV